MKVTVDVECSPAEARAFLGLPDVQPMQAAVMEHVQRKVLDAIGATSPDALLRAWAPLAPQTPEAMRDALSALFRPYVPGSGGSGPQGGSGG